MTESPFPSTSAEPTSDTEAAPAGRRGRVVAGGLLVALALGAGAFFLLGGDSADAEQELSAPGQVRAAAAPAPAATTTALPAVSTVELGRNPFKALYVQPVAAPAAAPVTAPVAAAPPAPPTGTVQQPPPPTGTAPPAPAPPPPPPSSDTGDQPLPGHMHEVQLASVTGDGDAQKALFSIDGKQYTVQIGDTFGPTKHLLLVSLQQGPGDDDWTAVVQVGDGDPFDVVTGDPVFVP